MCALEDSDAATIQNGPWKSDWISHFHVISIDKKKSLEIQEQTNTSTKSYTEAWRAVILVIKWFKKSKKNEKKMVSKYFPPYK